MAFDFNSGHKPSNGSSQSTDKFAQRDNPFRSTTSSSSPTQPSSSGGFQNRPTRHEKGPNQWQPTPRQSQWKGTSSYRPQQNPFAHKSTGGFSIPWRTILTVCAVVAVVLLCVIYRRAITSFLMTVLSWAIAIALIFLLLKLFVFRGRRR